MNLCIITAAAVEPDKNGISYYINGIGWELFPKVLLYGKTPIKLEIDIIESFTNFAIGNMIIKTWNTVEKKWYIIDIDNDKQLEIVRSLRKVDKFYYYHFN